jgi:hypothetical protein
MLHVVQIRKPVANSRISPGSIESIEFESRVESPARVRAAITFLIETPGK